jgi:hypothetical protein
MGRQANSRCSFEKPRPRKWGNRGKNGGKPVIEAYDRRSHKIRHYLIFFGYHVQGSKGKNLPTPLVCLTKMERSLDRNEIGCRRLNGRPKEKYPRKQLSEK